jgi:hypothetical protein
MGKVYSSGGGDQIIIKICKTFQKNPEELEKYLGFLYKNPKYINVIQHKYCSALKKIKIQGI